MNALQTFLSKQSRRVVWAALFLCAGVGGASAQILPSVQRGTVFAQSNCERCHSIDKVSPSSLALAPPFRTLHLKYPVDDLAESLAEGIMTGHSDMPEFRLDPGQIDDFLNFLKSL